MIEVCVIAATVILFILAIELLLIFQIAIKIVAHLAQRIESLEENSNDNWWRGKGNYESDELY